MSYLPLLIQLVSGAVGGNALGRSVKSLNLGTVGNSIAGLVGGGLGGQLLASLADGAMSPAGAAGGMDVGAVVGSIAGGLVGGGAVTAGSAFFKTILAKPT
jgi:hypothetical protein